jgi:hypothetical protein
MSHATVLVIHTADEDLDTLLAPFNENYEEGSPYFTFKDEEEKLREEWETKKVEQVKMKDGSYRWPWDDMFRTDKSFGFGSDTHKIPEGLKKVKVAVKDVYATYEEFLKDYHGYDYPDPRTGKYGYWHNENQKWDWFQVGGRWTGFFLIKPDAKRKYFLGSPGLMTPQSDKNHADSIAKGDIDFDGMVQEQKDEARKEYQNFINATAGIEPPPPWAKFRKLHANIEEARSAWSSHPFNKALDAAKIFLWMTDVHKHFFIGKKNAEEKFVARAANKTACTFAVLKDGVWYENGEMGWWGLTTGEKMKPEEWTEKWWELVNSVSDETMLTVVDFHV